MFACNGYAAQTPTSPLAPFSFERRDPGPNDVQIDILYCGICHSDIHTARGEWNNHDFPVVPGHEIVGKVVAVGSEVSQFKVGDLAGVGCMVDSCRHCPSCTAGLEQYCEDGGFTGTYAAPDKKTPGMFTYGGYSKSIVVDQGFVLRVPTGLELAAVAPLLCAGITTYSPLRHWKVGPGSKVGIVGLGGLGHMGLKIAHAMGAEVTLFTTSPNKAEDAKRLGAHHVVISKDADQMASQANTFDFVLDCVSAQHDINAYLAVLKRDGTLVQVGAPPEPLPVAAFNLIMSRKSFAGSLIGGIAETQEMLDFCAKHNIVSDIEMISIDQINEAYERVISSDVKYRFVIDMQSLAA
ncbi:NAD(P)-dependent alcohol dehydrogenase [Lichenicola cladoniae]|uniref:NAD(P)-dependent alcohol dehydrogenase n=1 Tax=Lichenicola cladoniae TaxID=1484109 RepID=A0A6M8HMW4_9PROT|nr:NAD(P)-dependent alcohol dehydrogenase [Lichenicola cladoniae]NPD67145.1 NAD(P)-dependent alcohol dehydrogenase [Acetobacteraceae bacterium]QKE89675.1 NAD(P)-dependent alcohol dehydrogenase [Lichenicola cladoniae]